MAENAPGLETDDGTQFTQASGSPYRVRSSENNSNSHGCSGLNAVPVLKCPKGVEFPATNPASFPARFSPGSSLPSRMCRLQNRECRILGAGISQIPCIFAVRREFAEARHAPVIFPFCEGSAALH